MPAEMDKRLLKQAMTQLGLDFHDTALLEKALTHKSFANEAPSADHVKHNERLEFLGDAVLSLVISETLMRDHPYVEEGELSVMRAALIQSGRVGSRGFPTRSGRLAEARQGRGALRGRQKASLLADAFEAVLGATYLDTNLGLPAARRLIMAVLGERLQAVAQRHSLLDPKSRLQELFQGQGAPPPVYTLVDSSGPDHNRSFTVAATGAGGESWAGETA